MCYFLLLDTFQAKYQKYEAKQNVLSKPPVLVWGNICLPMVVMRFLETFARSGMCLPGLINYLFAIQCKSLCIE